MLCIAEFTIQSVTNVAELGKIFPHPLLVPEYGKGCTDSRYFVPQPSLALKVHPTQNFYIGGAMKRHVAVLSEHFQVCQGPQKLPVNVPKYHLYPPKCDMITLVTALFLTGFSSFSEILLAEPRGTAEAWVCPTYGDYGDLMGLAERSPVVKHPGRHTTKWKWLKIDATPTPTSVWTALQRGCGGVVV